MMWPLLLCSISSLAIIFEKAFFFSSVEKEILVLKDQVIGAVRKGDMKAAVAFCDAVNSPLSGILRAGLLHFGKGKTEIKDAMEGASSAQVNFLEQGVSFLGALGSVAPLLGFLGTIMAMGLSMRTFQLRLQAMNPAAFQDIVGDVWAALITTAFGLLIAIPIFLAYHYFTSRIFDIVFQMERAAMDLTVALMDLSGTSSLEGDEA
ncbi:MAG: MotA/TolQ/ExbB proton channel family protein [Candidatus Omnitrophica bacterium]|nr:MotA/TolQ/ExbB proton channel family protein [Candidatus Omnitrophota bacterium]